MPWYAKSLARHAQLEPEVILSNGLRMVQALEYIHGRDWLHMDVKVRVQHGSHEGHAGRGARGNAPSRMPWCWRCSRCGPLLISLSSTFFGREQTMHSVRQ